MPKSASPTSKRRAQLIKEKNRVRQAHLRTLSRANRLLLEIQLAAFRNKVWK